MLYLKKWKWCRFDCSNQHGNMGDNLVNLPENEEYQSTQEVTKGKQRILKFWSWGGMGQQEIILTSNLQLDPIFLPNFFFFLSCGNNNMSGASALCVLTPYLVACAVWQPCLFYLSNKQDFCCERVLLVSLTSFRQTCNLKKRFFYIYFLSQHVSTTGVLFTWWFFKDRENFLPNKNWRNRLAPESESGVNRFD